MLILNTFGNQQRYMLKVIFLTYLLGSVFLINTMKRALINEVDQTPFCFCTDQLLDKILEYSIVDYYQTQIEIQKTFDNALLSFDTHDLRLFCPRFPSFFTLTKNGISFLQTLSRK